MAIQKYFTSFQYVTENREELSSFLLAFSWFKIYAELYDIGLPDYFWFLFL